MNIHFLGSGPTDLVKGKGKNRRTNTSALVSSNNTTILIGLTKFFDEQIEEANIKPAEIDCLLLTHGHNDMTGGISDFKKWLETNDYDYKENPVPVYCESETEERAKEDFEETSHLDFNEINPEEPFSVDNLDIMPFRVEHSEDKDEYPTVGFRFGDKLTWAEDVAKVPVSSRKYFDNVDTICIDAAMWFGTQINNHLTVDNALNFLKDKDVKKVYLVQAGRTYPDYEKAEEKISKFWEDIEGKASVKLAYDGLKVSELVYEDSSEIPGIKLQKPHGDLIFDGKKTMIVRPKKIEKVINTPLYVVQGNKSKGMIKVTDIEEVALSEFKKLSKKHQIKDKERKEWWKGKRKLYIYDFTIVKKFNSPVRVKETSPDNFYIKDVKFETSFPIENIEDVSNYDPSEVDNKVLSDDMRIVMAWYASKRKGKNIRVDDKSLSLEDIVNLAKLIYDEIEERKDNGEMKHEWKPNDMSKYGKELFYKVKSGKLLMDKIVKNYSTSEEGSLKEVIPKALEDMTIIDSGVCLVGSAVTDDDANDIDILLRMDLDNDFLERGIAMRIEKKLKKEGIMLPVHIFSEKEGPHDDFIPLYDLVLKRREDNSVVEMSDVDPTKIFKPVKTTAETYYDINNLADKLFGGTK